MLNWDLRISYNQSKEDAFELMKINNPVFIPRNHLVEEALEAASTYNNMDAFMHLNTVLANPYAYKPNLVHYTIAPETENGYATFCNT
jgi:serine/tyrosine/threonine adenylyltransferase